MAEEQQLEPLKAKYQSVINSIKEESGAQLQNVHIENGKLLIRASTRSRSAEQTYTVKPGDIVSKISKQLYGDARQYQRIFEANRDRLNDPDKIQAGQVLKIPQ